MTSQDGPPFGTYKPSLWTRLRIGRMDLGQKAPASDSRFRRMRRWLRRSRPTLDIAHRGLKLRLYPGENVCDLKLAVYGDHPAHEELGRARDILKSAKVYVDVGANIGFYSLIARSLMPAKARLIAFEPDPVTHGKLRQNLAFNAADNVIVINAAVGAREETLTLYMASKNNVGRNTLKPELGGGGQGVSVPVRPLVTMLEEQGVAAIDVMKVDVEGFEAEALTPFFENAPQTMWPTYLMLEIVAKDHWNTDLLGLLSSCGYDCVYETPEDMHFRRSAASGSEPPSSER